jgi:quercetin dioxygenase-like cupin family protein
MAATIQSIDHVQRDNPIALLTRRRVFGEQMLWAYVDLAQGCEVAMHSHENEQIAYVISGRVRWKLGEPNSPEYREQEVAGGTVVHLPGGFPHGVQALADSVILDVLAPPGEMGVDRQDA